MIVQDTVTNRLVVTGSNPVPQEISMGLVIPRDDLKTSHEEADVIMPQQMVVLAIKVTSEVISDDTDVFILLVYYYLVSN